MAVVEESGESHAAKQEARKRLGRYCPFLITSLQAPGDFPLTFCSSGCRQSSAHKHLTKVWIPRAHLKKPGMVGYACNPQPWRSLKLTGKPAQVRDSVSRKQNRQIYSDQEKPAYSHFRPSHVGVYTHTQTFPPKKGSTVPSYPNHHSVLLTFSNVAMPCLQKSTNSESFLGQKNQLL